MLTKNDHLYLVDGSSYIFRAYHALPPLTRKSDGLPVGAVSGFCNMLLKLMEEMDAQTSPSHLAVIFDASGTTFRNEIFSDYKANRGETPEDLIPQFPLVREAVKAFGVPSIELQDYEADDLIAAYADAASAQGAQVTIVSSDKDLMQLVNERVDMLDTMKDRQIGPEEVFEKFGVGPERVIDVQSLAGDSVDNIPGVPGIGVKTAALLINEFGDLDTLLARAEEIKQNKRRENLIEFADQARLSRELVTLKKDTPMPMPLGALGMAPPDGAQLIGFLKAMEFNTLTKRVAKKYELDLDAYAPAPDMAAPLVDDNQAGGQAAGQADGQAKIADDGDNATSSTGEKTGDKKFDFPPINAGQYECVTSMAALEHWIDAAYRAGVIGLDTETDGLDTMQCRLVGISLATAPGAACYIPLAHGRSDGLDLDNQSPDQLALDDVLAALAPMLADASVLKVLQNAKFDMQVFARHHVAVTPIDDTMLMSYAVSAGAHGQGMDELSRRYLDHEPISIKTLLGTGKSQITFDQVPLEEATAYAAEDADVTLRLWHHLKYQLVQAGVSSVYETTERPLIDVIVGMERHGVKLDRSVLSRLSGEFAQKMAAMEARIHELAGEPFNIASPKQLGEILFERMGLEGGKKTKTGAWGTAHDVLENLAAQGHELPAQVLDWRGLAKLKSTYTDALPEFINPDTGRVHTSYALASTTTGRLSSSDPNLQNIPIRTEDGRRIRTAFIAEPDHMLVSADYSQIELRLLAHIADIDTLKQAFADGLDIHAMTASEMFGVPMAEMTPEVRRRAKAINFGIIYGISAFGLANQLGISRGEASDYIKSYFEKFPGIKDYMEAVKAEAHAQGYVSTLFGRKVHLPEISSKIPARRAFAERAAINAPIQGSAADIIRRAMIAMPPALEAAGLNGVKMLLQVHDELIFEVPENDTQTLMACVEKTMQQACAPRLELSVPLVVEAEAAKNWDEAH